MEDFKLCPFCGSSNIGVKDIITKYTTSERKVWAYCRACGVEGVKQLTCSDDDDDLINLAKASWNNRQIEVGKFYDIITIKEQIKNGNLTPYITNGFVYIQNDIGEVLTLGKVKELERD